MNKKIKGHSLNGRRKDYFAHPSAVIDKGAAIGSGVKIWHFSHIESAAIIGRGCKIGQNVYIANNARIGNNVKIQNNVSIYSGVVLEDDVFCGPSMVFTNIINPRSAIPRNSSAFYRPTVVKKGATIGANATIVCGHTLGRFCFIGAGSIVTKDVPDYGLAYGNPARLAGWMCECGEKLKFKNKYAVCYSCGRRYQKNMGQVKEKKDREFR